MALQNGIRSIAFAAPLLLLVACSHGGSHHGSTTPGVANYYEAEQNGHPTNANFIGSVAVGDYFVIRGQVSDVYNDWFDGFWMWATEDVDVEFILTHAVGSSDLDVGWYDPANSVYVEKWETSYNPETGILPLYADEDFHLVVTPWFGTSTYTLEVIGHPVGYFASSAPPAPLAKGASEAPRERTMPFERYASPLATALEEDPPTLAEGEVIELDLETGEVRSRAFEVTSKGLRVGPIRLGGGR
jgi:hypothetical protein